MQANIGEPSPPRDVRARRRQYPLIFWGEPIIVLVILGGFYSLGLHHQPTFDELYHVMAARGWLLHGEPVIAEGVYERAQWFTWLVSVCFRLFGDNLVAARVPTVLPMAALGALLFVWMRSTVGATAAWLTTLLYGLSPFAVEISAFIRFYALQCLAFFIAAICLYRVIHGGDRWPWIAVQSVIAALCLGIASYFQITTLIGALGLGAWFSTHAVIRWLNAPAIPVRWRVGSIFGLVLLAGVVLIMVLVSGVGAGLLEQYRSTPYFNQTNADSFWFYHYWINFYYPSLWPFLPFLTLAAFVAHPRVTIFSATIFMVAFLLHSFAAAKNLRYMAYAMPFLFILLGTGIATIWQHIVAGLTLLDRGLSDRMMWLGKGGKTLGRVGIAVAILFLFLANTGLLRSGTFLAGITLPPESPNEQWEEAMKVLGPELATADLVVTANEMETLYYFGNFDVIWGASRLSELSESQEFSRDPRTGRPIISTAESLENLQACYPEGIFITSTRRWNEVHFAETEIPFRELLIASSEAVELPESTSILAYRWNRSKNGPADEACDELAALLKRQSGAEGTDEPQ